VKDSVLVLKNQEIIGFANIVDICRKERELYRYFDEKHPHLNMYKFAILNNEYVYIVDFLNDNGQGGYLKNNLRKVKFA
jgi:hypothetical protein